MAKTAWQKQIRPHHLGTDPLLYDLMRLFLRHHSAKQVAKKFRLPLTQARCLIFSGVLSEKNAEQLLYFWHEISEPRKKLIWLMEEEKENFYQESPCVHWKQLETHLPNFKKVKINLDRFDHYNDYLGFLSLELH